MIKKKRKLRKASSTFEIGGYFTSLQFLFLHPYFLHDKDIAHVFIISSLCYF